MEAYHWAGQTIFTCARRSLAVSMADKRVTSQSNGTPCNRNPFTVTSTHYRHHGLPLVRREHVDLLLSHTEDLLQERLLLRIRSASTLLRWLLLGRLLRRGRLVHVRRCPVPRYLLWWHREVARSLLWARWEASCWTLSWDRERGRCRRLSIPSRLRLLSLLRRHGEVARCRRVGGWLLLQLLLTRHALRWRVLTGEGRLVLWWSALRLRRRRWRASLLTREWRWWSSCVGLKWLQWHDGVVTPLAAGDDHPLQHRRVDDVHHQHRLKEGIAELRVDAEKSTRLIWRGLYKTLCDFVAVEGR